MGKEDMENVYGLTGLPIETTLPQTGYTGLTGLPPMSYALTNPRPYYGGYQPYQPTTTVGIDDPDVSVQVPTTQVNPQVARYPGYGAYPGYGGYPGAYPGAYPGYGVYGGYSGYTGYGGYQPGLRTSLFA